MGIAVSLAGAELEASDSGFPDELILRVELYDFSAQEALRIQQQAAVTPHLEERREEILGMVDGGEARLVHAVSLIARLGSRAKSEDVESVPVVESFTWNEEARQLVPQFAEKEAGTIFEVDPSLAEDGETLDINFALEHHTGRPEMETITVPMGQGEASKEVTVTRFHLKKVTTRLRAKPGAFVLIGAFAVTGEPFEAASGPGITSAKRLAFLSIEVPGLEVEVPE